MLSITSFHLSEAEPDVKLVVGTEPKKQYMLHSKYLRKSDFFAAQLSERWKNKKEGEVVCLELSEFPESDEAFQIFLRFLYSEDSISETSVKLLLQLSKTAEFFQYAPLEDLSKKAITQVMTAAKINGETVDDELLDTLERNDLKFKKDNVLSSVEFSKFINLCFQCPREYNAFELVLQYNKCLGIPITAYSSAFEENYLPAKVGQIVSQKFVVFGSALRCASLLEECVHHCPAMARRLWKEYSKFFKSNSGVNFGELKPILKILSSDFSVEEMTQEYFEFPDLLREFFMNALKDKISVLNKK